MACPATVLVFQMKITTTCSVSPRIYSLWSEQAKESGMQGAASVTSKVGLNFKKKITKR
jgi:hypothetical protein